MSKVLKNDSVLFYCFLNFQFCSCNWSVKIGDRLSGGLHSGKRAICLKTFKVFFVYLPNPFPFWSLCLGGLSINLASLFWNRFRSPSIAPTSAMYCWQGIQRNCLLYMSFFSSTKCHSESKRTCPIGSILTKIVEQIWSKFDKFNYFMDL